MVQALMQPSPLAPGKKLDRYELLCPIAEGGMASVWIARLVGGHGFEKLVAIKMILPQFASDARFQRMFVEESRIASRIEHPNVAQIRDVGEHDGLTYLVMEYVDGESLWALHRTMMRKGSRLPPGILLRIMADVCGGLHAAHELRDTSGTIMRVVHRDVSPQNVLVSSLGAAKLIDFGIAKSLDGAQSDTNTGPLKGKVRYMAPEQARGEPLDRRADVWAVGAVLYYLFSGRAPCEGENEVATLIRLRTGEAPDPLPSSVHPAIAAVVMKALGMRPDKRFAMAIELQRALENAMAEAEIVTTTAAVAAFIAEHAPEGSQKRRSALALGMKAAADRSSSATVPDFPVASSSSSLPPLGTGSTMRAAAVEVAPMQPPRSRALPAIAAVLGGLLVLGAGVTARYVRRVPAHPASSAPPASSPPPPAASAQPSARPAPTGPSIRTVEITDLPSVPSAAAAPAPARVLPVRPANPAPSPSPAAAQPKAEKARGAVDDGF